MKVDKRVVEQNKRKKRNRTEDRNDDKYKISHDFKRIHKGEKRKILKIKKGRHKTKKQFEFFVLRTIEILLINDNHLRQSLTSMPSTLIDICYNP